VKIFITASIGRTAVEMTEFCRNAFQSIGHEVKTVIYNDKRISRRFPIVRKFEKVIASRCFLGQIIRYRPDIMFVVKGDNLSHQLLDTIRKHLAIPLINYWIDDPYSNEVSRGISPFYDYFFTNDPDSVPLHLHAGSKNVFFLSFGYDPKTHKSMFLDKKEKKIYGSDLCFSGTITENRFKILQTLADYDIKIWSLPKIQQGKNYQFKYFPVDGNHPIYNRFTGRALWGNEMVKAYNASKIILNIHSHAVPTMREFEVTGCGAFLLTDPAKWLDSFFTAGREIQLFQDISDLKNKIDYYLSHSEERKKIAERGYQRTIGNYSYANRMSEILTLIKRDHPVH
jgi:spore maturation protein CgeB